MAKDLQDIERSWAAREQGSMLGRAERLRLLMGWWGLTVFLIVAWIAAWVGWGNDLGSGLQRIYGVVAADAPWWLRADSHLHALIAALVTVWAAWAGRLFTSVGSWLGPPVALLVVIVDEVIQIGQEGRSFEWRDPVAGVLGILIAAVVIMVMARLRSHVRDG